MSITNQQLPPEIEPDLETIAEAVHISWMRQRRSEGWTYAPEYSREQKTTPNMVDYGELPESEKETDRVTVRQVVATLIRLGYQIGRS